VKLGYKHLSIFTTKKDYINHEGMAMVLGCAYGQQFRLSIEIVGLIDRVHKMTLQRAIVIP
jgi:hypothetical protein